MDKILHQLKRRKRILVDGAPHVLKVDAKLHQLNGNARPYFSLTGEVWDFRHREDPSMCGCIHDVILEHFPDLQIIADLHLSDEDGVPMHAVENGWYWYGGTKWQERENVMLASHLRVPIDWAQEIPNGMSKDWFTKTVDSQRPRWKREAKAAIELLKSGGIKCHSDR